MTQVTDWERINANNIGGAGYAAKTDDRRTALRSLEMGPTAPVNPERGQPWVDSSNEDFPHLKFYTGAAWVTAYIIDRANRRIRAVLDNDLDTYIGTTGVDGQIAMAIEGSIDFIFGSAGVTMGSAATALALDMSGKTSALALPKGTTTQRPSGTPAGTMRHNTTLGHNEQAVGSQWEKIPVPGDIVGFKQGTEVNVASIAWANFTNIPPNTRIIRVFLDAVNIPLPPNPQQAANASHVVMQLGDSGGYETTGYTNGIGHSSDTNGFNIAGTDNIYGPRTNPFNAIISVMNMSGEKWAMRDATNSARGVKTLSGELDRVRFGVRYRAFGSVALGSSNFSSGKINILYT